MNRLSQTGLGRFKATREKQRYHLCKWGANLKVQSLVMFCSVFSRRIAMQEWNDSVNESMIRTSRILLFLLSFIASHTTPLNAESSTCLMVYKEGGAPAVFQSPKCPRWRLSNHASRPRTVTCQSAISQGRRKSQEDRTFCALDVRIPFPGTTAVIDALDWSLQYILIGCRENIGKERRDTGIWLYCWISYYLRLRGLFGLVLLGFQV